MTSRPSRPPATGLSDGQAVVPNTWRLQDAKARFSEVVRRAADGGPQHVTVRGRDAVTIVDSAEWRRLTRTSGSGTDIVAALRASPHKDVEIEPERWAEAIVLRDIDV